MAYASQQWTKNLMGQTLKTAKDEGLLGSGNIHDKLAEITTNGTTILANEYDKYKMLAIYLMWNGDGTVYNPNVIFPFMIENSGGSFYQLVLSDGDGYSRKRAVFNFTSKNSINVNEISPGLTLCIYGIK